ncbi:MAG: DNA-3-methyladenine glycosylase family protein [Nocardioides sp.]|uniref:DNA-3-methyladenine glycosylase family protein n=1 Tax=Nocardioides sp. TaxID=35761 RepID=UPI003F01990A
MQERERTWRPDWPCPALSILAQQRHGGADPTCASEAGAAWRAFRTPQGPATLRVEPRPADGTVEARAWGSGAEWILDQLPALLGADDDVTDFDPGHPLLVEAWRRHHAHRFGRSGLVLDSLVPAVIEQKVTGQEAFAGHRALVRRFGEPAPVPDGGPRLWVAPTPDALARVASWDWLALHIDPARSRTIVNLARSAASLERLPGSTLDADRALRSLPGVGVWTSAEVRQRSFGDADAVSYGDYHIAKDVGWAMTGEAFDDTQLAEFLEPWRGHRGRVVALIRSTGLSRPRRGPRMAPRTHLPGRTPGSR